MPFLVLVGLGLLGGLLIYLFAWIIMPKAAAPVTEQQAATIEHAAKSSS